MNERDPVALRHLLVLRQCPIFAASPLGELAVLAENAVDATFPAGATIDPRERLHRSFHIVVEGQLAVPEPGALSWGPREVYGMLEALAGRRPPPAIAAVRTRALELGAADLDDILEDNFGLLSSVLRALAARVAAAKNRPRPASHVMPVFRDRLVGLVERLIVLRQLVPFATARLHPLSMLAHAATELTLPVREVVAHRDDPAHRIVVVLAGRLRATAASGAVHSIEPGEAIGALETLGGIGHDSTIEVVEPVRALELPGARVLDILEDHTDLALSIVATCARTLLDEPARAGEN